MAKVLDPRSFRSRIEEEAQEKIVTMTPRWC